MATGNLGRVQGGSLFFSNMSSSRLIDISSLSPDTVKPLIGDSVFFGNGDLRKVENKTSTQVALSEVIANFSGNVVSIELDAESGTIATEDLNKLKTNNNAYITYNTKKLTYQTNEQVENVSYYYYALNYVVTTANKTTNTIITCTVNGENGAYTIDTTNYEITTEQVEKKEIKENERK